MAERKGKRGAAAAEPEIGGDKNECIKVAIRCRPLNTKEVSQGHVKIVNISKERGEIQLTKEGEAPK